VQPRVVYAWESRGLWARSNPQCHRVNTRRQRQVIAAHSALRAAMRPTLHPAECRGTGGQHGGALERCAVAQAGVCPGYGYWSVLPARGAADHGHHHAGRGEPEAPLSHAAAGRRLRAACQATEPRRAGVDGEWRPGARGVSASPGERTSRACGAGHAGSPQHQWEGGQGAWYGVGAGDRWQRPFEIPILCTHCTNVYYQNAKVGTTIMCRDLKREEDKDAVHSPETLCQPTQ
jgi:hypothetical protein